jgi:hypothetical protein
MVAIMIGSSCDSNHQNTRESFIQVTSTIPQSGDELLPLYPDVEEDGVDIVKGASEAALIAPRPLSLLYVDPYCVFHVSPPPHRESTRGRVYNRF